MTSMLSLASRWWRPAADAKRDERGSILVEVAIIMPIIVAVIISVVDIGLYILAHQKSQRTATTVGDLVARLETATTTDIVSRLNAADHVMNPFDFATNGGIIISSISKEAGELAQVDWQISQGGAIGMTSQVGAVGANATLQNGMVLQDGENVIVAEVEYDYDFLFADFLDSGTNIYHDAIFRPRGDALSTLD